MNIREASNTLNGRPSKVVGNNTRLVNNGDSISLVLHTTAVLTWYPNGDCIAATGGWYTRTTKDRINEYAPHGWRVFQRKHEWFWHQIGPDGRARDLEIPFSDNLNLRANAVLAAQPLAA